MIILALIAAVFMSGDWLSVIAHTLNYNSELELQLLCPSFFEEFKKQCFWAVLVGFGIYFGFCGYLEWKYYVKGRGRETEWKCQPKRYLSPHLVWDQIKWGCIGLLLTNVVSAMVATHVSCGGYSKVYIGFGQYPWWWWILQWPVIFVQQVCRRTHMPCPYFRYKLYVDYATYWIHRSFHSKFLFKHFHSIHHRYFQPTPWSVTAIHPFEIFIVQLSMIMPIFIYPIHWFPFYSIAFYTYYHGIVQHSGITFKAQWWQPWQPDCMFHDNHHQYCHVNFGFNCYMWDKGKSEDYLKFSKSPFNLKFAGSYIYNYLLITLRVIHGSIRKVNRCYSQYTDSWGSGRPLDGMSNEELNREIQERITENPTAYHKNLNPYLLQDYDKGDVILEK